MCDAFQKGNWVYHKALSNTENNKSFTNIYLESAGKTPLDSSSDIFSWLLPDSLKEHNKLSSVVLLAFMWMTFELTEIIVHRGFLVPQRLKNFV